MIAPVSTTATRTRSLVKKQSKYGCTTCKKRKVRCDEALPVCARCMKSGRECAGYARISKTQQAVYRQKLNPEHPLGSPEWDTDRQQMISLTLDFVSSDPYHFYNQAATNVFSVLLPQLTTTWACVSSSAAALGAAYDHSILRRKQASGNALGLKLYLEALRQIQEELRREHAEIVPILMAATLLAATESVQQQQHLAFSHVAGAFSMIRTKSHSLGQILPSNGSTSGLDALLSLFNSLDQIISQFTWGRIPSFPPTSWTSLPRKLTSIEDLLQTQATLQQHSLHFLGNVAHATYSSEHATHSNEQACVHHKLPCQQKDLVAGLEDWLSAWDVLLSCQLEKISPSKLQHLQLLKAQALASFIAISNIKPRTQTSYDAYAHQFDEIIGLAEEVLGLQTLRISTCSSGDTSPRSTSSWIFPNPKPALTPFAPVPGLIQPLSFVAQKYRSKWARRRAIELLSHAGIEGPFHAAFEACVASQMVTFEEHGCFQSPSAPHSGIPATHVSLVADQHLHQPVRELGGEQFIPEANRICVAWITMHMEEEEAREPENRANFGGSRARSNRRLLHVTRARTDHVEGLRTTTGGALRMLDGDGLCSPLDLMYECGDQDRRRDDVYTVEV